MPTGQPCLWVKIRQKTRMIPFRDVYSMTANDGNFSRIIQGIICGTTTESELRFLWTKARCRCVIGGKTGEVPQVQSIVVGPGNHGG